MLIKQFLGESFLVVLIASLMSIGLLVLLLPAFNTFVQKEISASYLMHWTVLSSLLGVVLLVGFLSGLYPALFLSSFQPVRVMKGERRLTKKGGRIRNILVLMQFCASSILIIGTITLYQQLHYIRSKKVGYNRDHVIGIALRDVSIRLQYPLIKEKLMKNAHVMGVTASNCLPLNIDSRDHFFFESNGRLEKKFPVYMANGDEDYLEVFQMKLKAGRNFSRLMGDDRNGAYIINEEAARQLGVDDPLGKK
jgi:putative ABC transport system permease protein